MGIWYATREQVNDSLEVAHTARANALIDAKLEAASRSLEGFLKRRFYPERRTMQVDWPNYQYAPTWTLWLTDDLISLEELSSGGTDITADAIPRRSDDKAEPPYSRIEIDLSSSSAFGGGNSFQRSISITGVWGDKETSTSLAAGLVGSSINSSVSSIVINPSAGYYSIGVGSLLLVGAERMVLTDRRMSDTGQNLQSNLDDINSAVSVVVSDGTAFAVGETILIDAERMRVDDIAGNTLIVTRAWDGSALATHTSTADIYALRTFTVLRGVLGSTAASHDAGASVYAHQFPGIINELCLAETVVLLEQSSAGYARTVGSGPSQRESSGAGLADIRDRAWLAYGRKGRLTAI